MGRTKIISDKRTSQKSLGENHDESLESAKILNFRSRTPNRADERRRNCKSDFPSWTLFPRACRTKTTNLDEATEKKNFRVSGTRKFNHFLNPNEIASICQSSTNPSLIFVRKTMCDLKLPANRMLRVSDSVP